MIKHTDKYPVSSIFSFNNNLEYKIPKYQREYTWGINEWNALFDDVVENDEGYFLGSYICVCDSSMGTSSTLELIDGQQRLTSLSLLLLALYSKLNSHKEELTEDEKTDLNNLKRELANKSETRESGNKIIKFFPKLKLQVANNDDYLSLLAQNEIIEFHKKPNNAGNRRIYKAYKHFEKSIEKYVEEKPKEENHQNEIEILLELVNKFNSIILVGIEVDTHKDAYMLFESLNNRGVPLSAIDLIKNLLISVAEGDGKSDECYDMWLEVLKNLGDNYSVQERFFRQYYNAFREELNKPFEKTTKKYSLGYLATKTTLLEIYEKLIKKDYNKFLNELLIQSNLYAIITNNSEEEKIYKNELLDLERIQGAPSYLLLLYLLRNQESMQLQDEHISKIVKLLTRFFVRRNITDVPGTRNLTKIFMDIISNVKIQHGDEIYETIRTRLINESASDELFEKKLRGPIYDDNDTATRFILCSIEMMNQTKEIHTDLWKRDSSNKYIWTIEHIFPEGQNIPQHWVNMIADGDRSLAEDYLERYVHTLGNLTITGYNQNLSNMSFEDKKNRKNKEGKDIGYRNKLYLNENVANEDKWTIEKIQNRTNELVAILLELYKW